MKQLSQWKQANPREQLVAILSVAAGHASNIADGRGDPKVAATRIENLLEEAQMILKGMPAGKWD